MSAPDMASSETENAPRIAVGEHTFSVRGGRLCIDFVNTVDDWHAPRRAETGAPESDYLAGYADLLSWAEQVGVVSAGSAQALAAAAEREPADADRVFVRATKLRSAIHDAALAAVDGRAAEVDLALLNDEVGRLMAVSRLEPAEKVYVFARPGERGDESDGLDRVLWPVVRSALALLTSPEELARVRECPGDGCGWLFYDASGRRRWCSMAACGTRHKVRRFRARQRSA